MQTIARSGTGVTRWSIQVRDDQLRQGLVDVKWFYKKFFFIHTHNYQQKSTIRHGPFGAKYCFHPFSMLSPPQDRRRQKKDKRWKNEPVDLTSEILTAVFCFFWFKHARIVKAKGGNLIFQQFTCGCTGVFTTRAKILVPEFQDLVTLVGLNRFVKSPLLWANASKNNLQLTDLQFYIKNITGCWGCWISSSWFHLIICEIP